MSPSSSRDKIFIHFGWLALMIFGALLPNNPDHHGIVQAKTSSRQANNNRGQAGQTNMIVSAKNIKDRYFSKSFGEIRFNKYRGQLPSKGSMIECTRQCGSLAACHCIAINIHTAECHLYGPDAAQSPMPYDSPIGSSANLTERDFVFFTRDFYRNDSNDKVDIADGRKLITSFNLDLAEQVKKLTNNNNNNNNRKQQSAKSQTNRNRNLSKSKSKVDELSFPLPWTQIEFNQPMYVTEIVLRTSKDLAMELKSFQIRIGNESIAKWYDESNDSANDGQRWTNVTRFERNNVCFEHRIAAKGSSLSERFFSQNVKKTGAILERAIKCAPCGLVGRFVSIQAEQTCESCKKLAAAEMEQQQQSESTSNDAGKSSKSNLKNLATKKSPPGTKQDGKTKGKGGKIALLPKRQRFPIPLTEILVFGYPIASA